MATVIGPNFDYDNLSTKSTYGFYSILKQQCTNDNTNATLSADSTTVFKWSLPCSHKAIKLDNMRLVLRGNVLAPGAFTDNEAYYILLMSEVSPIVRYEIKTKSGQLIQRSDYVRSFVNTFYDRVQHNKKKPIAIHSTASITKIAANNQTGNIINIDGFFHSQLTEEEKKTDAANLNLTNFRNYGYIVSSGLTNQGAGDVLNEVVWSISLRDLLGGFFENEVDLILPNDMLELSFELDSNFLLARLVDQSNLARSVKKKCNFKLSDIYIKMNVQEDAEINKYLVDKVKNGYLLFPYEHIQTHSITKPFIGNGTDVSQYTLNQNIFSGSGSILRKIYITTNFIPSANTWSGLINFRSNCLLNKVRIYINSTYLGEYESQCYDNYRGNVNHITNGFYSSLYKYTYNIPFYFNNPENHESKIEGLIISPSSNYNIEIEKNESFDNPYRLAHDGTRVAGNINYDIHIVTVKILYINSQGAVVMNSLEETTLNAAQIPLLTA